MADKGIPHFHNDAGVAVINIGATAFQCIGAKPPFAPPHVFLELGDEDEIVCPYCSTLYRHRASQKPSKSEPAECHYEQSA